jgi:cyclase
VKQVTTNIYVETGYSGCNPGFVMTREGILMIDAPILPADSVKWQEEIAKKGQMRYLINTDQHPDHFWGNYFFPTIVIANKEARESMQMIPADAAIGMVTRNAPETLPLMEGYQVRLPHITFTESMNLYLGDHTFELLHLPGHATGVSGVYIPEERAVFASDCIFYKSKTYLHHATPDKWLDSIKKLGELDIDIIIPGHGDDVCTKAYLEEQTSIIEQWVEVVKSSIQQGYSEEEATVKISCPDPYPLPKFALYSETELNKTIITRLYQVLSA